ncbi:uncharacterized protein [Centruroides vittatus]|uniref:uncharacterized protein n=1 Tax=Centruroides vittatus TaxID=120091 RepID=UPI003510275B
MIGLLHLFLIEEICVLSMLKVCEQEQYCDVSPRKYTSHLYLCSLCNAKYSQRRNLRRHERIAHNRGKLRNWAISYDIEREKECF